MRKHFHVSTVSSCFRTNVWSQVRFTDLFHGKTSFCSSLNSSSSSSGLLNFNQISFKCPFSACIWCRFCISDELSESSVIRACDLQTGSNQLRLSLQLPVCSAARCTTKTQIRRRVGALRLMSLWGPGRDLKTGLWTVLCGSASLCWPVSFFYSVQKCHLFKCNGKINDSRCDTVFSGHKSEKQQTIMSKIIQVTE